MTDWTKALDKLHRKGERFPDGCLSGKDAHKKGWKMMDELTEDSPVGHTNTRKIVAKACFKRWAEESDLDLFEMTAVACDVLNELCGETTIEFESDIDEL